MSGGVHSRSSSRNRSTRGARGDGRRDDYMTYLGRSASDGEIDYWVDQFLHHGSRNEDVIAGFIGSAEYYADAQKRG